MRTKRESPEDARNRAAFRLLCQTDLYALARGVLYAEERIAMTDGFHKPICQWLQTSEHSKHLIMVPRGFYKTGIFTVARNIQRILVNPQVRILIASNKAENAEAMLAEIKALLTNRFLLWAFPDILVPEPERYAEKWTTAAIVVKRKRQTKEATVETTGESGEITSKHYDYITFDDMVGQENSQTREMLAATIAWWKKSQGLCEPHTIQDVIGTPWHYADLYGWMQEQKAKAGMDLGVFKRACWENPDGSVPARPGPETRATFPERWPIPALMQKLRDQGSDVFAAQCLVDPVDEETAVFARSKLKIIPRREIPPIDNLWIVMTVDPAISTKAWADYSAIAVTGWDQQGTMHVLDLRRGRWAEDELLNQMYDCYRRFPTTRSIGFEAIGFAKIFRRLLERAGQVRGQYLPVVSLERDTKITKNLRIRTLQPLWEGGEMVVAEDVPALEDLLDEASRFRTYKESAHDDLLDALADSLQLRLMPGDPEKPTAWLSDDPEMVAQLEYEQRLLDENPTLDRASLRSAWGMQRRREQFEREREVLTGASAMMDW